ncbi:MAG: hypothetical protein JWM40_736, partial [Frankiales bacterium]|nr:hypothetical protein [Frankiales bacterium]
MIGYVPGSTLCHLTDNRITEASGIVASDLQDGVLFVHNDSGDTARFFALGTDCRTRATYVLPHVPAVDWEDIARGPGHVLWLGDIGDNRSVRTHLYVNRVTEPVVGSGTVDLPSTRYALTYPDGPHNAETLLADPRDGRLYVLTKTYASTGTLYAAPLPLSATSDNRLVRLETVTFPFGSIAPTGGDISPDGT